MEKRMTNLEINPNREKPMLFRQMSFKDNNLVLKKDLSPGVLFVTLTLIPRDGE